MATASRSNGTQRGPCAHYVRFTESQNDSLHRVAKFKGKTIQAYLHEAAMEAIARDLRVMDEEDSRKARARGRAGETAKPIGLGIRERLETDARTGRSFGFGAFASAAGNTPPDVASPDPSAPNIVINNVSSTTENAPDIERLAHFVVNGPNWDRDQRLQQAVRILTDTAKDREDGRRLAQLLDARVTALGGKKPGLTDSILKLLMGGDANG